MGKIAGIDERDTLQADNKATRIPVILALDTSGSMGANGGYIALNEGVDSFYRTCKADSINGKGFDVCVVTFGGDGVKMKQDFRPIWNQKQVPTFEKPENGPYGTPLAQAVDTAIRALEARREGYRSKHISHTRLAFLFVITDGQSTEIMRDCFRTDAEYERSCATYEAAAKRAQDLQRKGSLEVVCVGVGKQNYKRLADFSLKGEVLHTENFSQFGLLFESLSVSASSSANVNDVTGMLPSSSTPSLLERMMQFADDEGIEGMSVENFSHDDD